MDFRLAVTVIAVVCCPFCHSQPDCGVSSGDLWISNGNPASISCGISNPKWWIATDPCDFEGVDEFHDCRGRSSCSVTSEAYSRMSSCVVCCTEASVSSFNPIPMTDSCEKIRVCPEVTVSTPSSGLTGRTVPVLTFVATKPPPDPNSVSVTANDLGLGLEVRITTDNRIHPIMGTNGNFTFFHTVHLPLNTSGQVLITVNLTNLPHGNTCNLGGSIIKSLQVVQVDAPPTTTEPQSTSSYVSTLGPEGLGSSSEMKLDSLSLGVGVGIGVVGMVLVTIVIVSLLVCLKCKPGADSQRKPSGGVNRFLLTENNTPAVTPSSENGRSLGQSSMQNTPATTPTESHNLLTHPPPSDPNYQEITPTRHLQSATIINSNLVTATTSLTVGAGPGTAPPLPPFPSQNHSSGVGSRSETRPSTLQPSAAMYAPEGYHTHGEAMHLRSELNQNGHLV